MDFDAIIVGAGVIGLSIARAFARYGLTVAILEIEGAIGTGTSSRNSEVIHAGLYYPTDSLKARLCVAGRRQLYLYCDEHGISYRKCGKLIVAAEESEIAAIQALHRRGIANGVEGLRWLEPNEARALEPSLHCVGALLSEETGIIDSHGFMSALFADAQAASAALALQTPFVSAQLGTKTIRVCAGGRDPTEVETRILVNCAGLHASHVASAMEGLDPSQVPQTRFAKGNYFTLRGRAPFSRLIYPAPHTHGLGVHLTLDLGGQARFGPDVEWVDALEFGVDESRGDVFVDAIRRYWRTLPDNALIPGYCGIRPKLGGPDDPATDFRIDLTRCGDATVINLFGIESPGLTSALAIADHVLVQWRQA